MQRHPMPFNKKNSLILVAVLTLVLACAPESQDSVDGGSVTTVVSLPRMADGTPNLNGIWQALNEANWNLEPHGASQGPVYALGAQFSVPPGLGVVKGESIPYLDGALAQRDENFSKRITMDPEIKCFMAGVPRSNYLPYPFQFIQSDKDILLAYQFAGAVRPINMGEPTDAVIPGWMGWSNGRWENDSLVVDVTGLNGNWLDRAGNYYSGNARVTERYTLLSPNLLEYEATIEDFSVYSEAWTLTLPLYRRQEANMQLLEYKCPVFAEEAMYGDLRKEPMENTLH